MLPIAAHDPAHSSRSHADPMAALHVPTTVTLDDGSSAFGSARVDLEPQVFAPPAPEFSVSEPLPADRVIWFTLDAGWTGDWHPAPGHQLYIQTVGQLEVTVSTGETRTLSPGDVLWTCDTTGIGHRSRVVGDDPAGGLFVQLPDDARPASSH